MISCGHTGPAVLPELPDVTVYIDRLQHLVVGAPCVRVDLKSLFADIMNSDIYSVSADTTVAEIAEKMVGLKIHRVLVSDNNRFIGLITTFDLLGAITR